MKHIKLFEEFVNEASLQKSAESVPVNEIIDDHRSLDELEKAIVKQMKEKESGNSNIKVSNEINILFSIYKNKGGKKTKKTLEAIARNIKN